MADAYLYSKRLEIVVHQSIKGYSCGYTHDLRTDSWWDWSQKEPSPPLSNDPEVLRLWQPHPDPDDVWTRYCAAKLTGRVDQAMDL